MLTLITYFHPHTTRISCILEISRWTLCQAIQRLQQRNILPECESSIYLHFEIQVWCRIHEWRIGVSCLGMQRNGSETGASQYCIFGNVEKLPLSSCPLQGIGLFGGGGGSWEAR